MTDWNQFTRKDDGGQLYFPKDLEKEIRQAVEKEFKRIGFTAETIEIAFEKNRRCILISNSTDQEWPNGWEQFRVRLLTAQEAHKISGGADWGRYGWELIRRGEKNPHGPCHKLSDVWIHLPIIIGYEKFDELEKQRVNRLRRGDQK